MGRPVTWLLGVVFALFLVGVSALMLTAPAFTRVVASKTSEAEQAGLPLPRMLQIAEQVRVFVVDAESPPLPATVDGRSAFDAPAVSHLVDVRSVLSGVRIVTGVLAAMFAVIIGTEVARKRTDRIAEALFAGAIASVAIVALAAIAATTNFDAFFSAFHGLFFKAGTWEFPADSLLIETFPEPFWIAAGASWGAIVALGAVAMGVIGWSLRHGHSASERT
jgi:integral membrane protein (TIGR01906 family)